MVLMNGFQPTCPSSEADTFGSLGPLLREDGYRVEFFNSCVLRGGPIESLAERFEQFIATQGLERFDVIAHSMGGLILRTYLSGKKQDDVFRPPFPLRVRRAIMAATPHGGTRFGEGFESLLGNPAILPQIRPGSRFLWDLGRWNQGVDDLREVSAIALVGTAAQTSDGVVNVTSAAFPSLTNDRNIALPYCHTSPSVFVSCTGPAIAAVDNRQHLTYRIASSFLAGTNDWNTVGTNATNATGPFANFGIFAQLNDAENRLLLAPGTVYANQPSNTPASNGAIVFWENLPAPTATIRVTRDGQDARYEIPAARGTRTLLLKPGPVLGGIGSSAGAVGTLSRAPGMFVALYGSNLAPRVEVAGSAPYPSQLAETTVTAGDDRKLGLYFVSPGQINAVLPNDISGVVQLTVQNPQGRTSLSLLIEPAVPTIYSADQTGTGQAAATLGDGTPLANGPALGAGDIVILYGTGLGSTEQRDGLEWALMQPTVTVGGTGTRILYAGRSPQFPGVDQINVQLPQGIPSGRQEVRVKSGVRISNAVTLLVK